MDPSKRACLNPIGNMTKKTGPIIVSMQAKEYNLRVDSGDGDC